MVGQGVPKNSEFLPWAASWGSSEPCSISRVLQATLGGLSQQAPPPTVCFPLSTAEIKGESRQAEGPLLGGSLPPCSPGALTLWLRGKVAGTELEESNGLEFLFLLFFLSKK